MSLISFLKTVSGVLTKSTNYLDQAEAIEILTLLPKLPDITLILKIVGAYVFITILYKLYINLSTKEVVLNI